MQLLKSMAMLHYNFLLHPHGPMIPQLDLERERRMRKTYMWKSGVSLEVVLSAVGKFPID